MSRFYDALKAANRSEEITVGNPIDEKSPELASNGTAQPSIQPDIASPMNPGAIAPAVTIEPPPTPRPEFLDEEYRLNLLSQNGVNGSGAHSEQAPKQPKVHAVLAKTARVLPNIANSVALEHYRRLRAKILQQHAIKPFRTLVIASPGPQEGKTVNALNLALSFAMLPDYRVLVIDGDLRKGALGQWIGVENHPGLSDLIEGTAELDDVILKCEDVPLHFMVRGKSQLSPAELLHSHELGSHFRRIGEYYDLVIVDSAPVNLVSDTHLIAAHCDAVLLVARAFTTRRKALERAAQDLSSFRVIGTVLNCGTRAQLYSSYTGYY